jgi:diphthamide biosynthesis methyltransferase
MVESASDEILTDAQTVDVAFLVVGDPFGYVYFHGAGIGDWC